MRLLPLIALAALAGCGTTTVPVVAVPNPRTPLATVQSDELTCRERAAAAAHAGGAATSNAQWAAFFASYTQCQRGFGNVVQPVPWAFAYSVYYGHVLPGPAPLPGY